MFETRGPVTYNDSTLAIVDINRSVDNRDMGPIICLWKSKIAHNDDVTKRAEEILKSEPGCKLVQLRDGREWKIGDHIQFTDTRTPRDTEIEGRQRYENHERMKKYYKSRPFGVIGSISLDRK